MQPTRSATEIAQNLSAYEAADTDNLKTMNSELRSIEKEIHALLATNVDANRSELLTLKNRITQLHNRVYDSEGKTPRELLTLQHYAYTTYFCMGTTPYEIESQGIQERLPTGLLESGLIDPQGDQRHLTFLPGTDKIGNWQLQAACTEILYEQIQFASLNLSQEYVRMGFYGRGSLQDPATTIATLVGDHNCKLQYLDLSKSSLMVKELITILKAIPEHSPLKCIYIESSRSLAKDVNELAEFLESSQKQVVIIGIDSKAVGGRPNQAQEDQDYQEAYTRLQNYQKSVAPNVDLTAKASVHPKMKNKASPEGSSTYH